MTTLGRRRSVGRIDWENGIFRRCVTARGRTSQLRHRGNRFALQFGLELAFANRLVLVRVWSGFQNGNSG